MAKVTFIVERDGVVLDTAVAEMTDEALDWSMDAVADAHGYGQAVDVDGNPIVPEVTKARFFSWMIRKWVERQVERYASKLAVEQAKLAAEALKSTVVVED